MTTKIVSNKKRDATAGTTTAATSPKLLDEKASETPSMTQFKRPSDDTAL
tara:strand:+ start:689 stop:838 length:150 start_codon:yes stop_codon:yes gene_type:complete